MRPSKGYRKATLLHSFEQCALLGIRWNCSQQEDAEKRAVLWQAATVSLLRIFTRSGETLCPILEHQTTVFSEAAAFKAQRPLHMERRSFDSCQKKQAERKPDMPAPARSQSLSLF